MPALDEASASMVARMIEFAFPHGRFEARGTWWKSRDVIKVSGIDQVSESITRVTVDDLGYEAETAGKLWWVPYRIAMASSQGNSPSLSMRVLGIPLPVPNFAARRGAAAVLGALPYCPFALDHPSIAWRAIDDTCLEASGTQGRAGPKFTYEIDETGRVIGIAPESARFLPGQRMHLRTSIAKYHERDGVRVPAEATLNTSAGRETKRTAITVTDSAVIR
ncbi:MAG: DUF6544 family protein [Dehalococcoidia bacterium]